MAAVDSLEIKIESEAKSAFNSLNKLEVRLKGISSALGDIGNNDGLKNLSKVANEISKSFAGMQSGAKGISKSIEPQTKKAAKSLDELKEKYAELGKGFTLKGDFSSIQKQIDRYENALSKAKLRQQDYEISGRTGGRSYENSIKDVMKYSNILESLQKQLKEVKKEETSLGKTTPQLSGWEKITILSSTLNKAFSGITKGVSKSMNAIKKLGTGFSKLYSVIGKISSSIGTLFSKMTSLASKSTNAVVSSVRSIGSAFSRLKGDSGGISNATSGLGKLAKTAAGLVTVGGLAAFGKQAVELGSDITEVENVVDTAFGSMADKVYKFAETASEKFGLSELAAKQYSGTMMAMLKSSGVAQKQASKMSITLAGLAGDLASFYNISTDEAFTKIRAGISGETEPLKQLGINMNIVNLEAYAMSQGIHKAYNEMTLAEQSILRYNYIIAKTGDAQGDFARTAGTWANQLRLLKLNIQSISAIIGQGLIAALLPAITLLNKFMAKLTQAATKFRDFMYVLFGKKIESTQRGVVDDMAGITDYTANLSGISDSAEEIDDNMEDAADGTDDLTSSMKKLDKQLAVLNFDELNQLPAKLDDLTGSTKSGNNKTDKKEDDKLDDLGIGDMSDVFDDLYKKNEIEPINKWAKAIRDAWLKQDWEGVGTTVAKMMNAGLEKVYKGIKTITPKVEKALKIFSTMFNAWVKAFNWELLGKTIGAGIGLLVKAFNALTDPEKGGINFVELGKGLARSFRGMIGEIPWLELGNAIGNGAMVVIGLFSGFMTQMKEIGESGLTGFGELGVGLATAVEGIFQKLDLGMLGQALADFFNGITDAIANFNKTMRENKTWQKIAKNITEGLTNAIKGIKPVEAAQALGTLVTDLLATMLLVVENTPWHELGEKIGDFLINIPWRTIIGEVFGIIENVFGGLITGLGMKIVGQLPEIGNAIAVGINTIFAKLGEIADSDNWSTIADNISGGLNEMISNIRWAEVGNNLSNFVTTLLGTILQVAQNTNWQAFGEGIGNFLISIDWPTIFGQVFEIITTVVGGLITGLGGKILEKMPEIGTALANGFDYAVQTLKTFVESMEGKWTEIGSTIATSLNNMIRGINWKEAGETFGGFIKGVIDVIFTVAMQTDWISFGRGIGDFLDGIPWLEILTKVVTSLGAIIAEVIAGLMETTSGKIVAGLGLLWIAIQGVGLANKVLGVVNDVAKNFGLLPEGVSSVIPTLAGKVAEIAGDGSGGSGLFAKIATAASGLVSKIGPVLGSIGSVIFRPQGIMIAGIAAGVALIIANWDSIKAAAGEVWDGVKTVFSDTWEGIKTLTHDTWEGLKTYLSDVWGGLKTVAGNIWGGLKTGISDVWGGLKTAAGDIWGAITGKVSDESTATEQNTTSSWDRIRTGLDGSFASINTSATSAMQSMSVTTNDAMQKMSTGLTGSWKGIETASNASLTKISSDVKSKMEAIKNTISTSMKSIGSGYTSGWKSIESVVSSSLTKVQSTITSKMSAVKTSVNTSLSGIQSTFKSKWDSMASTCSQALGKVQSTAKSKMSSVKSTMDSSMNGVVSSYQSTINKLPKETSSALGNIASEFKKLPDKISSSVGSLQGIGRTAAQSFADGFKSVHIPTPHIVVSSWTQHTAGDSSYSTPNFGVNWYKKGGLAYNPSVVGIGEAGHEAILPLENPRVMSEIADRIMSQYSGGIANDVIAEAVEEGVVMALMNNVDRLKQDSPEYIQNNIAIDGDTVFRAVTKAAKNYDYRHNPTPQYGY